MLDFRICVHPKKVEEYQPWIGRRQEYKDFLEQNPFVELTGSTRKQHFEWWTKYENEMLIIQLCAGIALEMQEYSEKVDLYEKGKITEKEVDDTLDRLIQYEIDFSNKND